MGLIYQSAQNGNLAEKSIRAECIKRFQNYCVSSKTYSWSLILKSSRWDKAGIRQRNQGRQTGRESRSSSCFASSQTTDGGRMVRGTALGERADLSRLLFRQPRTLPVLSVHAVHLQRLPQPVSFRMGRIMQSSKLGYQTWAVAFYIAVPNIKGISSMKLHRALGITEKPLGTCSRDSARCSAK